MKRALITGITGQDGSFLAEFLIEKGYEVHGIIRRSSSFNTSRIEHLYLKEWIKDQKQERAINLHYGDMTDSSSLIRILQQIQPDEIYNLAAQSHVKVSFDVPEYTAETDAVGTLRLLEAIRILGLDCSPLVNARRQAIEPYVNMSMENAEWLIVIEDLLRRHDGVFLPFCFATVSYIRNFKMAG